MKKNVFSVLFVAAAVLFGTASVQAQKTIKLFNGKDLSNWNFIVDKNSVPADRSNLVIFFRKHCESIVSILCKSGWYLSN